MELKSTSAGKRRWMRLGLVLVLSVVLLLALAVPALAAGRRRYRRHGSRQLRRWRGQPGACPT